MILQAFDATTNGATQLQIHSPDIDVPVLALRRIRNCVRTRCLSREEGNTIVLLS